MQGRLLLGAEGALLPSPGRPVPATSHILLLPRPALLPPTRPPGRLPPADSLAVPSRPLCLAPWARERQVTSPSCQHLGEGTGDEEEDDAPLWWEERDSPRTGLWARAAAVGLVLTLLVSPASPTRQLPPPPCTGSTGPPSPLPKSRPHPVAPSPALSLANGSHWLAVRPLSPGVQASLALLAPQGQPPRGVCLPPE